MIRELLPGGGSGKRKGRFLVAIVGGEEIREREEMPGDRNGGLAVRLRMLLRLFREYSWKYRLSYALGGIFLWLTNDLSVGIPGVIGQAVDSLGAGGRLGPFAMKIFLMGIGIILVRSLSRILIFNPGRHQEYLLRRDLFAKLMRLQPAFYSKTTRGDVISRATNDLSWIRTMVGFGGLQLVNVSLAIILSCWKMFQISPRLSVVALAPILLAACLVQLGIRRIFVLGRRTQEQLGEISEHVLASLQGMAVIQGYVAEKALIRRFEAKNLSWMKTSIRLSLIRASLLPLLALSGGISMFVLLIFGGRMAIRAEISVGELAAFAALLTVLLPTLRSMGWMFSVFARGLAALERVFSLMDAEEDRPEAPSGREIDHGKGPEISIRGLHFAYPDAPDRKILHQIDAGFSPGELIGVWGPTASGKSTLLRLLARLYNPQRGAVFVNGVDLLDLDLDSWRRRMAFVSQRPFLFSETIRSNVLMAESLDPDRLERVVEKAALREDLEALPDGLDTVVGERGISLSGGQRQRVALARALYRGACFLILDDVLSAVDHSTEQRLVDTLLSLQESELRPTVLMASHRLSVLQRASRVLVLEEGRSVALAPHRELIETVASYRSAWELQQERPHALAGPAGRKL